MFLRCWKESEAWSTSTTKDVTEADRDMEGEEEEEDKGCNAIDSEMASVACNSLCSKLLAVWEQEDDWEFFVFVLISISWM